ncbi:outer membrane lipoprotein-sorting protein [Candidatus Dependentiae bacterium]|nr:outer membrane lipoprotein-sorting protein [Candidatus Dependentiae bacterium]
MKRLFYFIMVIMANLIFIWDIFPVYSQDLSVEEIVKKANIAAYYAGKDGKSDVNMIIKDNQGRQRERMFTVIRKNIKEGEDQNFYVYFHKPADVRKMVFLVLKHITKDDDRWLYMANLDLVKRIASSDKRTSFVGSDFVYEDVSGRNISEDEYSISRKEGNYYVLKCVPKDKKSVEFSHYFIWINKTTFIPEKAEYYKGEKVYRKVAAVKIENIQNIPTVVESQVENIETGSVTISKFSNVKYNINVPDEIFSERFLRRPPMDLIKK